MTTELTALVTWLETETHDERGTEAGAVIRALSGEVEQLACTIDVLEQTRRERDRLRAEVAALSADLENVQTENDQRAIEGAASRRIIERAAAWFATHTIAAPHNKADSIAQEMTQWLAALADKGLIS